MQAQAAVYQLSGSGSGAQQMHGDMVGAEQMVLARHEDTLVDIARRNDLGFDEIVIANTGVDAWLPGTDTPVRLPQRYLLPEGPREGIVINVAEMRLYYFPKVKKGDVATVETYPISIGRSDWNTPLVTTRITRKVKDPVWYPPASLKAERIQNGDPPLDDVYKAGPDNPLGQFALYLSIPSYLIHGTNRLFGIGMQVTHGCMRLYPEDIERLYQTVPVGTGVRIVNQPVKTGWHEGVLYLEIHPWLEGTPEALIRNEVFLPEKVQSALVEYPDYPVDWHAVELARIESDGTPIAIGPRMTLVRQKYPAGTDTLKPPLSETPLHVSPGFPE